MKDCFIKKAHLYFNTDIIDIISTKRVGNTIDMFKYIVKSIDEDMCNQVFLQSKTCLQRKISRTFFNYILCTYDKRILELCRKNFSTEPTLEAFELFLELLFYVGKGRKARSLSHIDEVRKIYQGTLKKGVLSDKQKTILSSFNHNEGIVILQCFDSAREDEALNRESCMIDGIGLDKLCNEIGGHKTGLDDWGETKLKNYGMMLLYKVFLQYISEETKPIKLDEILVRKSK